ncbi:MAG: hypothetical protein ACXVY6_13660 [Gaiellaceae bacterium]
MAPSTCNPVPGITAELIAEQRLALPRVPDAILDLARCGHPATPSGRSVRPLERETAWLQAVPKRCEQVLAACAIEEVEACRSARA